MIIYNSSNNQRTGSSDFNFQATKTKQQQQPRSRKVVKKNGRIGLTPKNKKILISLGFIKKQTKK